MERKKKQKKMGRRRVTALNSRTVTFDKEQDAIGLSPEQRLKGGGKRKETEKDVTYRMLAGEERGKKRVMSNIWWKKKKRRNLNHRGEVGSSVVDCPLRRKGEKALFQPSSTLL